MPYTHTFDLCFNVKTMNEDPTREEIIEALYARYQHLKKNPDEIKEACGLIETNDSE